MATHYEGEPCDNTAEFYKWVKDLKKSNDTKAFQNLNYTVFGLGDTAYEHFNAMGRYFDKIFGNLGAKRVHQMGEGNSEGQLTEEQFEEWKNKLWENVAMAFEKINPNKGQTLVKNLPEKSLKKNSTGEISIEELPLNLLYIE